MRRSKIAIILSSKTNNRENLMPYRVTIPEGELALDHILNRVGTDSLLAMRQQMFKTVYSNHDTTLTPREREGMRILLTDIMGCPVCNSLRMWRDYPGFCDDPIAEEFYEHSLEKNFSWAGFSRRESLAIQFADRFANHINDLNGDDDFWDELHANFSEREIGDMCFFNGCWLGAGHTLKSLGIGSVCEVIPGHDSAAIERLRNPQ